MRIQSSAAPVVCFAAILSSGALALAPVGGCASSDTGGFTDGGTGDTGSGSGSSSSSSNPFGGGSSTSSNPFGGGSTSTSSTTSPFGGGSSSTTNPGGSTSSTSQSSSSSTVSGSCAATDSGGISLMSNYVASSVIGDGGYGFAYDDMVASTSCVLSTALCGAGSTGVASTTVWGGGIGFNLNQAMATGSMSPPVDAYPIPTTATGITYALSSLEGTMRIVLTTSDAPDGYGYTLTAASGTVPWASFNTTPWAPATGTALTGAPQNAQAIEFEVVAGAAPTSFNFCVTSVSFAQ